MKKNNKASSIDNNVLVVELEDGKKINANILFTFNENGDQFILYEFDNTAYAAKIKDDNTLEPINDDEWNLVEKIFNEWNEEQNKENIDE